MDIGVAHAGPERNERRPATYVGLGEPHFPPMRHRSHRGKHVPPPNDERDVVGDLAVQPALLGKPVEPIAITLDFIHVEGGRPYDGDVSTHISSTKREFFDRDGRVRVRRRNTRTGCRPLVRRNTHTVELKRLEQGQAEILVAQPGRGPVVATCGRSEAPANGVGPESRPLQGGHPRRLASLSRVQPSCDTGAVKGRCARCHAGNPGHSSVRKDGDESV